MSNKIQGEGDYEAARRFNKAEQDFVKRKFGKRDLQDALDLDDPLDGEPRDDDDKPGDDLESLRRQGLFSRSE